MNIETLTLAELRQIAALFPQGNATPVLTSQGHPWAIGANYFIRTVTHHLIGKLVAVFPTELVLEQAAWIADDGRFAQAVKTGEFAEVEPFPDGKQLIIGRGSLIDAVQIESLNRSQK